MLPSTAQSIGQKHQLGLLSSLPLCNERLLFIAARSFGLHCECGKGHVA